MKSVFTSFCAILMLGISVSALPTKNQKQQPAEQCMQEYHECIGDPVGTGESFLCDLEFTKCMEEQDTIEQRRTAFASAYEDEGSLLSDPDNELESEARPKTYHIESVAARLLQKPGRPKHQRSAAEGAVLRTPLLQQSRH